MIVYIFVGIIVAVLVALLFVIGLRASKLMEEMESLEFVKFVNPASMLGQSWVRQGQG